MLEIKKDVNNKKYYIDVFENITELSNYVSKRPTKPGRRDEALTSDDSYFYGTDTFQEAVDLLKYGDEELYKEIKIKKEKIDVSKLLGALNKRQTYEKKVYGCIVNVPAFLQNNPINMINVEKHTPNNRILNIFLNIRIGGATSTSVTKELGVKYLTILDLLEKAGYRCNLYSGVANSDSSELNYSLLLVRIKTDKEPLNLKKICYTIANASMQRRIKFRWQEVNDCDKDFSNSGYGNALENAIVKRIMNNQFKDKFIVWNYECENSDKTIEKLLSELEKEYGIKIGE